jgi:competence protein ComEC
MKYLWHVSVFVFVGYLSGYFLKFSGGVVRVSLLIFLLLSIILFLKRKDNNFKSIKIFLIFILFFVYGNIIGNAIRPAEFKSVNINDEYVVKDVKRKENMNVYFLDRLIVYSRDKEINVGDRVNVLGEFQNKYTLYPDKDNLKSFNLMDVYRKDGYEYISFQAKIEKLPSSLVLARPADGSPGNISIFAQEVFSIFYSIKQKFKEKVFNILVRDSDSNFAAIVPAMIFGYEDNLSEVKRGEYAKSGLAHLLVLSGYNLSILCVFIFYLFRNHSKKIKLLTASLLILIFISLADFGDSFLRAIFMTVLSILAIYLNRESDSKYFLALFTILFIIIFPTSSIFSISFHLSLIATIAILYLYPIITRWYLVCNNKDKNNLLTESLLLSLSVSLLIYPYAMYQFGYINLFSFLFSAIATIFVPFVMLFGFIGVLFGLVSDIIAKIFLFVAGVFLKIIDGLANFGSGDRFVFVYSIDLFILIICYTLVFFLIYFLNFFILYKADNITPSANTNKK